MKKQNQLGGTLSNVKPLFTIKRFVVFMISQRLGTTYTIAQLSKWPIFFLIIKLAPRESWSRPRVLLAPLQFGLGVQLYHHFSSRFLINSLHHHGFCCSYQEVQQFEHNAAQSHGTGIPNLSTEFVQYGADNVDHNIRTLDGHGTFHGMGMVVAVTPETSSGQSIPRAKVTSLDVTAVGRVQIRFHKELWHAFRFKGTELLWKSWCSVESIGSPRPAWCSLYTRVTTHLSCSCL